MDLKFSSFLVSIKSANEAWTRAFCLGLYDPHNCTLWCHLPAAAERYMQHATYPMHHTLSQVLNANQFTIIWLNSSRTEINVNAKRKMENVGKLVDSEREKKKLELCSAASNGNWQSRSGKLKFQIGAKGKFHKLLTPSAIWTGQTGNWKRRRERRRKREVDRERDSCSRADVLWLIKNSNYAPLHMAALAFLGDSQSNSSSVATLPHNCFNGIWFFSSASASNL